ncbi:hypothetical protein EON64_20940 [archaeon]|nr:MAG: hypothetical protein EON64_20940 [archaeon]
MLPCLPDEDAILSSADRRLVELLPLNNREELLPELPLFCIDILKARKQQDFYGLTKPVLLLFMHIIVSCNLLRSGAKELKLKLEFYEF